MSKYLTKLLCWLGYHKPYWTREWEEPFSGGIAWTDAANVQSLNGEAAYNYEIRCRHCSIKLHKY